MKNNIITIESDFSPLSLTHRRRDFILSKSILNPAVHKLFQRAKFKLKCVLFWSKIIKEIRVFGTGSSLFDGNKNYKENLETIMKNKFMNEREKENMLRFEKKLIILPHFLVFKLWNATLSIGLIYTCTLMPWAIAFEDSQTWGTWYIFDIIIDVIYFIDIIITLNLAYRDINGVLIIARYPIFKNYLKGMLLFDVLAVFPFNLILNTSTKLNTYIKLLRVARMLRIFKAFKLKKIIENMLNSRDSTYLAANRLIIALILMAILIHFSACMWNFLPRLDNFSPDTWISRNNSLDYTKGQRYLTAIYFVVYTIMTVGFGEISAHTNSEMTLCIILELVGIGFYSFVFGVMTTLITSIDNKKVHLKSKVRMAELYCKDTNLSKEACKKLSRQVRCYYESVVLDEEQRKAILMRVPNKLKYHMSLTMFKKGIQRIFFFKDQEKSFLAACVPKLSFRLYKPRVQIFNTGDYPDEIYFLITGKVAFVFGNKNLVFNTVMAGSYFGEIGIKEKELRDFGAISCVECETLIMAAELMIELAVQYPKVYEKMKAVADVRKEKNLEARRDIIDLVEIYEIKKYLSIEDIAGSKRVEKSVGEQTDIEGSNNFEDDLELQNKLLRQQLKIIKSRLDGFEEKFEYFNEVISNKFKY